MIRDHANETPPRGHSQAGLGTIPGPLVTAPRMSDLPSWQPKPRPSAQYCTQPTAPNGRAWNRAIRWSLLRAAADRGGSRVHSCQRHGGWFASSPTANARTNHEKMTQAFIKCSRVSNFEQTPTLYGQRLHRQRGVVTEGGNGGLRSVS
jgi:hypothetical protein